MDIQALNPWQILGLVILTCVVITLFCYYIIPRLIKKGYPIQDILKGANDVLEEAQVILNVVDTPNKDGTVSKASKLMSLIISVAREGVTSAEQLYSISQIEKDTRKDVATKYAKTALQAAGVQVTPDIEKVIEGTIESSVKALGYAHNADKLKLEESTKSEK